LCIQPDVVQYLADVSAVDDEGDDAYLPAEAQALPWLQAAAAMERVHPEAAGQADAAAVKAWPAEPADWLSQGNAHYAQGRLAHAGEAFEAATRLAPDFADAWNNLAQVRAE